MSKRCCNFSLFKTKLTVSWVKTGLFTVCILTNSSTIYPEMQHHSSYPLASLPSHQVLRIFLESLSSLITSLLLQRYHHFSLEPWQWTANLFAYVHCRLFSNSFSTGQPQPSFQNTAWPASFLCLKSFSGCLLPWAKSLTRPKALNDPALSSHISAQLFSLYPLLWHTGFLLCCPFLCFCFRTCGVLILLPRILPPFFSPNELNRFSISFQTLPSQGVFLEF